MIDNRGGNGSSANADAFRKIFDDYFLPDSRLPAKHQRFLPLAFQCDQVYRGDWNIYMKRITAELAGSTDEAYRDVCSKRLDDIVKVLVPLEEQLRSHEIKAHNGVRILTAWKLYEEFSRDTPVDGTPHRRIDDYFTSEAG